MTPPASTHLWRTLLAASLTANVGLLTHTVMTLDVVRQEDLDRSVQQAINAIDYPVDPHLERLLDHMRDAERHETAAVKRNRIREVITDTIDVRLAIIEKNQRAIMARLNIINGDE